MRKVSKPKLGQHFLSSERYRCRIVESLDLRRDELAIEIGPGNGALTELLAAQDRRVIAIELDPALAQALGKRFETNPKIKILNTDILSTDIARLCKAEDHASCSVIGNLPYYITSPILHHLMGFRQVIRKMWLLMQREVAERVTAAPGSRNYGYLSVAVQLSMNPETLFGVPPGAFSPPPKVQSALVEFRTTPKFAAWTDGQSVRFLDFVKLCFAQKRKNLTNNLSGACGRRQIEDTLVSLRLSPNIRAEQMSIEQFADLHARLCAGSESRS